MSSKQTLSTQNFKTIALSAKITLQVALGMLFELSTQSSPFLMNFAINI
jgi:hypothetical protein